MCVTEDETMYVKRTKGEWDLLETYDSVKGGRGGGQKWPNLSVRTF